jgi:two-component sensor histidine kinase
LNREYELPVAITETDEINLSYDDNVFSFEFAALSFTAPQKNQYAYKLEGFDPEWNYVGTKRDVTYTNLDPGEYVFRVKGSNNDGVWNEAGASIRVIIAPPFWETWWFRVAVMLVLGAGVAWVYDYRVRHLLKVERLRSQIANDLHDDIGSTLTHIGVCAELIRSGKVETEKGRLLESIENMAREVMVTMSDIVWSIDSRHDRYSDLIDRMHDVAYKVLSLRQIRLSIRERGMRQEYLAPELRQNLFLIFKEAVNNVVRHAEATSVEVEFLRTNHHLEMVIRDDGRGVPEDYRAGHGIRNMQMRAERLKGRLEIRNRQGTVLILTIPVRAFSERAKT